MKVTVNMTSVPKGVLVDVAQSYALPSDSENRNIYINLGQFANGTTTEVEDILVTQYGCVATDVLIGEEETARPKKSADPVEDTQNA